MNELIDYCTYIQIVYATMICTNTQIVLLHPIADIFELQGMKVIVHLPHYCRYIQRISRMESKQANIDK